MALSSPRRRPRDPDSPRSPGWISLAASLIFLGISIATFLLLPAGALHRIEDSLARSESAAERR